MYVPKSRDINIAMNHSIEHKLSMFLENKLSQDIELKTDDLPLYNIRHTNLEYINGTLFEKGSMNWSQNFKSNHNRIFIGAYSSIRDGGYMRDNIFMGRHSGIGRRCTIAAGMHNISGVSINSDTIMAHQSNYSEEEKILLNFPDNVKLDIIQEPVIIENDVFLGDGIVVMPGVTIGTGSVIAANAVVSTDIEPYTIAGGIPAKPLRDRFPDKIKEQLLETKWWNIKLDILKTLPVDNVFRFIEAVNELDSSLIQDDIPTLGFNL